LSTYNENQHILTGSKKWHRYVGPDGKRQDAAHRYVHPLLQDGHHPNLHILLESKVIRVLFDESSPPRAIGTIKAKKLVVVTAGALGSPQVLERSGVGNPAILKALDIPVVSDLPGVGENYQDHHVCIARDVLNGGTRSYSDCPSYFCTHIRAL
jgi:alcohol oxidase